MPVMVGPVLYRVQSNDPGLLIGYVLKKQQLHTGGVFGEDREIHRISNYRGSQEKALAYVDGWAHRLPGYFLPSCSFAAATMRSGSNPNLCWSSLRGAEAPKVFMPMMCPEQPT